VNEVTGFLQKNGYQTGGLLGLVVVVLGFASLSMYRNHLQEMAIERDAGHLREKQELLEELRETRDYLENLLEYANAPIIVWDPSFRITRFNRAFEHMTDYSAGEVVGRELSMLFPEASRSDALAKISRTLGGEHWESVEIRSCGRTGRPGRALELGHPLRDGRKDRRRHDRSGAGHHRAEAAEEEKLTLERQMQQAQRMESLGCWRGGSRTTSTTS